MRRCDKFAIDPAWLTVGGQTAIRTDCSQNNISRQGGGIGAGMD